MFKDTSKENKFLICNCFLNIIPFLYHVGFIYANATNIILLGFAMQNFPAFSWRKESLGMGIYETEFTSCPFIYENFHVFISVIIIVILLIIVILNYNLLCSFSLCVHIFYQKKIV